MNLTGGAVVGGNRAQTVGGAEGKRGLERGSHWRENLRDEIEQKGWGRK